MTATAIALLACIGVVGLILNSAIQKIQRNLNELTANQQRIFPKVHELEAEIINLKRGIRGMQREIDRLNSRTSQTDIEDDEC